MTTTTTRPSFDQLLAEAINQPGSIMKGYYAFREYSLGNQLLAIWECHQRGLELQPINTFKGWQALGRYVKKGEKALTLCLPISVKRSPQDTQPESGQQDHYATIFVHKPRWFLLSQTDGAPFELPDLPTWNATQALIALNIIQVPFTKSDGNCQGYSRNNELAINPVAQLPQKTFFHEFAHILLGHTNELANSQERTPKEIREIEAEAVALLCCEALQLEGSEFCRGYIQHWSDGEPISEASARRIISATDKILKAGSINNKHPDPTPENKKRPLNQYPCTPTSMAQALPS